MYSDYRSHDVAIVGAGLSGMAAAIYAARNGARALLIERGARIGGRLLLDLAGEFHGWASCGLMDELMPFCQWVDGHHLFDRAGVLGYLQGALETYGVSILTCATVFGAELKDGKIRSLRVLTVEGEKQLSAAVYVDATGMGNLAELCHNPSTQGRSEDGKFLPPTLYFTLFGADGRAWEEPGAQQELSAALTQMGVASLTLSPMLQPGHVAAALTLQMEVSPLSAVDVSTAQLAAQARVQPALEALRRLPGLSGVQLAQTAPALLFPEGRHVHGRYTLDTQDLQDPEPFSDWAASRVSAPIELPGMPMLSDKPVVGTVEYTIPYRALLPVAVKNLLLCGRCISGTHRAHGSYRALPACAALGQAAGTAAALAVGNRGRVRKVDVAFLQEVLRTQGVASPRTAEEAEGQRAPQRPIEGQLAPAEGVGDGYFTAQVAAQRLEEEDAPPPWTPPLPLDAAAAQGLAARPAFSDGPDEGEWTVEPLWPQDGLDGPAAAEGPEDGEPPCV